MRGQWALAVILWAAVALAVAACGLTPPALPGSATAVAFRAASAPNGAAESLFCPILTAPQVVGLQVYPLPQVGEPPPRVSFHDPDFGLCLARVSDHSADLVAEDRSTGLRPEAANVPAFNADSSLILARSSGWFWYVYAADNLQMVMTLPFSGELEARWDPISVGKLYVLSGTRLSAFTLSTGQFETIHDFAADLAPRVVRKIGTGHIGNPTGDGRYWSLLAESEPDQPGALMVYDRFEDRVTAHLDLPPAARPRGVLLSPRGNFVVVWYEGECPPGEEDAAAPFCGVVRYNRQLKDGRLLLTGARSLDTALDAQGREVLVYHDALINSISYIDLASGLDADLWLVDSGSAELGMNISGQAVRSPGWALISTYGAGVPEYRPETGGWMDNAIFAVELKPDGRVARLAHTYSTDLHEVYNEAWFGPQATVNASFTRVLFTSNWGRVREGHMDIVMIGLPPGWSQELDASTGRPK